jgi:Flp pilus assembly protein TadG
VIYMKRFTDECGQSLVEFAIILPILLLLIMGIIEFGLIMNSCLTIQNASREGARIAIVGAADSDIRNRIISDSPNLQTADLTIDITPVEGSRSSGDTITVAISYNYHLVTPFISSILNNSLILHAQTSMRME